jgi:XRE family transcriptional regulator
LIYNGGRKNEGRNGGVKISLKAARVNANLTQEEVAKLLRKNKQTIVNWENGKTVIDVGNFTALCQLYKIDKDCIFCPRNKL